jgi:predicted transcriptional regulator
MRRSKLEMYIDILEALSTRGPLKLTHIMYKSNVNCNVLKEQLYFLIKNNMVQERILRKEKIVYAIAPRGTTVLRTFREVKAVFPEEEERCQLPPL